jgi:hypothetical protein
MILQKKYLVVAMARLALMRNYQGLGVTSYLLIPYISLIQNKSAQEVYPQIMEQVSKNKEDYVWKNMGSVEELGMVRMLAMTIFLRDYEQGIKCGRYINASLPKLPFEDEEFDLALCSHYLFLYSEHVNQEQHILSMRELCRVASEVRVYPLLSIGSNKQSPHLEPVVSALNDSGISVSLVPVEYEFQRGATEMLVAKCV